MANEKGQLGILVEAVIDKQKSENRLNTQIKQLQTQALKIGVEIDAKTAKATIQEQSKYWQKMFQEQIKGQTVTNDGLKKMGNYYKQLEISQQKSIRLKEIESNRTKQLDRDYQTLLRSTQNYYRANKNIAGSQFDTEINNIMNKLSLGTKPGGYTNIKDARLEVGRLQAQIRDTGLEAKTFWQRVGGAYAKFGSWAMVTGSLALLARSFRNMVVNVKEIDTAMTELKKVTNEVDSVYKSFLDGAAIRAKKLGSTISDIVLASADFARLGYSISDASKLADSAIVYKNVGDGISNINEASSSIISTMKANIKCLNVQKCA